MHPVAQQYLEAGGNFSSKGLCKLLADKDPVLCLNWSVSLVELCVMNSTPNEVASQNLDTVKTAISCQSPEALPQLDELEEQLWHSRSLDESMPFLHRALARLAWATMGFICHVTSSDYHSEAFAISFCIEDQSAFHELFIQCGSAIDMLYRERENGIFKVAESFSVEMDDLQ